MKRIGIDLGGTKIAGIELGDEGEELGSSRAATPRGDYGGVIAAIGNMVAELADGAPCTVGIGIPGSLSPVSGLVQNANSTWINAKPFQQDLEAALGQKVRLANDANCLALSEALDGAAQGALRAFGVILGTGCGGAVVTRGKLDAGRHAIAGEWGHNSLPRPTVDEVPGPKCWCGRNGCLETWISGPALSQDHMRETGEQLSSEEIGKLALKGDARAQASLERHLGRTARGLAHVVNIIDPDIIVIGGGLVDLPGLVERLPAAMAPHVFAETVDVVVKAAEYGPASGVRGAARLWDDRRTNN